MDPIILAFILGGIFCLMKLPIKLPKPISKTISNFLLLAIGFKGGLELTTVNLSDFIAQAQYVILMGLTLPLLAFPILRYVGKIDSKNSASIAAHYGSVSVGTFAVGIAYLQNLNVNFESYTPVFVAILEIPAILIGILLARSFKISALKNKEVLKEIFLAKSILLIIFGIVVGTMVGKVTFTPFLVNFMSLFKVALGLFLFDMGQIATKEIKLIKGHGLFLLVFGMITPVFFAVIGGLVGLFIGLTAGGATILAMLAASASYIAVPAAMKISIPEASPSLSLAASLGITFPFNVVIGIPLYYMLVTKFIY